MPKGPKGERRPADVVGCAVKVAKIATGEIEDEGYEQPNKVKGGRLGAAIVRTKRSAEKRKEIARKAASVRWKTRPTTTVAEDADKYQAESDTPRPEEE